MTFYLLRGAFILLAACVTMLYVMPFQERESIQPAYFLAMVGIAIGVSSGIILLDVFTPRKKLSALSGVFLGLLSGLLAAYALSFVVDFVGLIIAPKEMSDRAGSVYQLLQGAKLLIGVIASYLSISFVIQTKDDFRFVIPYVEFAKQVRGNRPIVLDTSVLIDGRVLDIVATKLFQGSMVVPRFVLNELQNIADSSDKLRRARGRRGLDVLQKLQEARMVDLTLDDSDAEGANVDQKLISLAETLQARVMTNDFNLNKTATVRGVDVVNLNDLARALRPVVLPGEIMRVKIIKPGESAAQGVGYLDDGTMVVVEGARRMIGLEVDLTVTSTLQTSAGRMIFGRCVTPECEPANAGAGGNGSADSQAPSPTASTIGMDSHAAPGIVTPPLPGREAMGNPATDEARGTGNTPPPGEHPHRHRPAPSPVGRNPRRTH